MIPLRALTPGGRSSLKTPTRPASSPATVAGPSSNAPAPSSLNTPPAEEIPRRAKRPTNKNGKQTSPSRSTLPVFRRPAMFNLSENSRLRGSGHLVLNIFRAFNIIGLLAVCVASWVIIVMSGITGNFFFFEAISHFFISTAAIFLICSEVNLFKRYYATHWPVLSPHHGLTWLGIAMVAMGCYVLGNLNRRAVTSGDIGGHFWRLILASGILAITFGFFNIIASLIFRDAAIGLNARKIRSDGAIASSSMGTEYADSFSHRSDSVRNEKAFKRLTQKINPWGNSKPKISRPIPAGDLERGDDAHTDTSAYQEDDRHSPIVPDLTRPPTAMHPIHQQHRFTKYSEASGMNRF